MSSPRILPFLVVLLLLPAGCSESPRTGGAAASSSEAVAAGAAANAGATANAGTTANAGATWSEMSVGELQARMEDKDFPLINVHIPFEGDLPGTDDSIPFDRITDHLDRLPDDRDATIVLYCRTGRMSMEAAEELAELGYTSVYNLTGGFVAWQAAGLPMAGG